jgi:proton-coupled amino acid transporter
MVYQHILTYFEHWLYQRNFHLAHTVNEVFQTVILFQVMPLENNMKSPRHFLGLGGVLNQGMAGVTLIYILLGFLGYLKYGETTEGSITLNLPVDEM